MIVVLGILFTFALGQLFETNLRSDEYIRF